MVSRAYTVRMQAKKSRGRALFPHHVSVYENQEGVDLLNQLAARRGTSQAALVRGLIREEARRVGLINGEPKEKE